MRLTSLLIIYDQRKKLQVFINSVVNYFDHLSHEKVKVDTPFLANNSSPEAMDYTGIIGISGPLKGCVYFSAPAALLRHLLLSLGEQNLSEENIIDLVGEVANTLSGNARAEFGEEFMISVPVVIEGAPSHIHLPKNLRSYVIPLTWKSYKGAVVICIQEQAADAV